MDYASKRLKKMDDATPSSSTPATSIASLPQEIILKILTSLPPKSAFSFRCTSKFFHSSIPQPHFKFRILFSFSFANNPTNLYTVGYTTEESHGRLQPSSLPCSADELQHFKRRLHGSSFADGKLCLFNSNGGISILDLSTRQYISLPQTFVEPGDPWEKIIFFGAALSFDPVSKRYKVWKSELYLNNTHHYSSQGMLKVLTLGVDESWRAVTTENTFHPRKSKTIACVQIDGIIYLINFKINYRNEQEIAVFDIVTENLIRVIPFPYRFQHRVWPKAYYSSWVKLNGQLAYIYVDLIERTRIFVCTLEKSLGPVWDKHEVPLTLEAAKIISEAEFVGITTNSIGEIVFLIRVERMPPSILIYACGTKVWRKFEICGLPSYSSFVNLRRIIVHVIEEKVYFSE
ncbi:PREDICTED: F-box only protein 8-like [Ipomoea nil]|uniref:F-box only protein 8-like n=1 Tax=Ipomoea nil TaxID=35883 RepID=UPI000901D65B|nr:PREDICTED: F-box only protein 8-like [Ipomoea nil]